MQTRYEKIKEAYLNFEKLRLMEGKLIMRTTDKGFWGTSLMDDIFSFFRTIHLEKFNHFLDLGSGDGRVVAIASLFTKATGVEFDNELINISKKITGELELDTVFYEQDFMKYDFSKHDFLLIYPDNLFTLEFEKKIKQELNGKFFVFNNIYTPRFLTKGKTYWVNQMPIIDYSPSNSPDDKFK